MYKNNTSNPFMEFMAAQIWRFEPETISKQRWKLLKYDRMKKKMWKISWKGIKAHDKNWLLSLGPVFKEHRTHAFANPID